MRSKDGKLEPGSIFLFTDYYFPSTGETKDKYGIVILDNDVYYAIVVCFTTSRVEKYKEKSSPMDYVFIPAGTSGIFSKDTLILIRASNMNHIERNEFTDNSPKYLGKLEDTVCIELLEKIKKSPQIPGFYKGLL